MSGLYNMLLGDGNEDARGAALLAMLGSPYVARFRDAWVENYDGVPVIAIYTRQGGGNRECYCDADPCDCSSPKSNTELAGHPMYIRDADDDFDSTYATFYFRPPPEYIDRLREVMTDPIDMSAQWKAAIDAIKTSP